MRTNENLQEIKAEQVWGCGSFHFLLDAILFPFCVIITFWKVRQLRNESIHCASMPKCLYIVIIKNIYIYVFIYVCTYLFIRGEERERNVHVREKHWLVFSCMHADQGPKQHPKHVAWLGMKPATFHFARQCPANWVTLVRAHCNTFNVISRCTLMQMYFNSLLTTHFKYKGTRWLGTGFRESHKLCQTSNKIVAY